MKTKAFSMLLAGMLLIALSPSSLVQAQSLHDWSRVQSIGVDERLIVKQKDGKKVEGKMIEATAGNLTLSRSGKVVNIPRDSIQQIEHSTGKAAKGKWAAIMAGLGAAAGAGIGAAQSNSIIDDGEIYILVGTVIGAGAGAVGGMAFGASRRHRELSYTAP
ncbi:MAG TPA: hypothetical protein VGC61_05090 [Pyrinomonadaceae bacterium]